MTQEIDIGQNVKPTYGYYRQPNGWITVSPATELEELHYRKEGWQPLFQYGLLEMNSGYVADHPLEQLFLMGGAHELCEEQIRQQGLYIKPITLPGCGRLLNQYHKRHSPSCWDRTTTVIFPQLASMKDLGPFACPSCGVEKPTVEARNQHLQVMHQEEAGDARMGTALAEALIRGQQDSTTAMLQEQITALRREIQALKSVERRPRRPSRRPGPEPARVLFAGNRKEGDSDA